MAKKVKHEDHINHEAWAIPYGDLITLLLAFFVVMYSMSSVNEGKYRVLSDSLNAAFGGPPRSPTPIQIGPKATNPGQSKPGPKVLPGVPPNAGLRGAALALKKPDVAGEVLASMPGDRTQGHAIRARERAQLEKIGDQIHDALGDLIADDMVIVRRHESWLEVEIKTDILFTSGSAQIGRDALPVLDRLADVLGGFPNRMRIEGHTDDRPIATREFPSNWELSSARAASVVHRLMAEGVDPRRMTVQGLAEYHPVAENTDEAGRNRNRRVVLVILAGPDESLPGVATHAAAEVEATPGPETAPPVVELAAPLPGTGSTNQGHSQP